MELWKKGRSFAEETAKRSQDLSFSAHKFTEIIAETAKGIVAQASIHLAEPSFNNDVDINLNYRRIKRITVTTFRGGLGFDTSVLNHTMFLLFGQRNQFYFEINMLVKKFLKSWNLQLDFQCIIFKLNQTNLVLNALRCN